MFVGYGGGIAAKRSAGWPSYGAGWAAAEDALAEARAAMKRAEGAFDAAGDRFDALGSADRRSPVVGEARCLLLGGPLRCP